MKVYVDSSVFLRRLVKDPGTFRHLKEWTYAVASQLLRLEVNRSLHRLHFRGELSGRELAEHAAVARKVLAGFEEVRMDDRVLDRAAFAFPTPVGALDAIHLATALLWREIHGQPLLFLTHDQELATAATACGLQVQGVP